MIASTASTLASSTSVAGRMMAGLTNPTAHGTRARSETSTGYAYALDHSRASRRIAVISRMLTTRKSPRVQATSIQMRAITIVRFGGIVRRDLCNAMVGEASSTIIGAET